MRDAKVKGERVVAGPDAPESGVCPKCGGKVQKRQVRRMDRTITYFYRHCRGEGKECPRRYRPT